MPAGPHISHVVKKSSSQRYVLRKNSVLHLVRCVALRTALRCSTLRYVAFRFAGNRPSNRQWQSHKAGPITKVFVDTSDKVAWSSNRVRTEVVVAYVGSVRNLGGPDQSGSVLAVLPGICFSRSLRVQRILLIVTQRIRTVHTTLTTHKRSNYVTRKRKRSAKLVRRAGQRNSRLRQLTVSCHKRTPTLEVINILRSSIVLLLTVPITCDEKAEY